ncbi:DUF1549 and DUF1553 domain-containing protein [Verrucomicrobia bacterium]|nr:DUF1549 and DUF1553 domain-containing protein [Verrucomicrobiota bacterium]
MHTHSCKVLLFSLAGLISTFVIHSVRAMETDEKSNSHQFSEEQKNWWAVQPLRSGKVDAPGNPIDFFVQRKLKGETLNLAEEAGPYEFIRRANYDLLGLPPGPDEIDAFVQSWEKDPATSKMELIDRLLADRAYGERWATHWLDVVRFSESDGYRADGFRPSAHLYRDYVARSLNEDKPYDQFVREQLAGDEINPDDFDHMVATGFLRHGVYEWNQRNARMQWELILNEMTNVTGEVFLGLGIGCAQCHDHKFDPILQKDYYSLQSFLSSVWWPEDEKLGKASDMAKLREWEKKTIQVRDEIRKMEDEVFQGDIKNVVKQFPQDVKDMFYKKAEDRSTYEQQLVELINRQIRTQKTRKKWDKKFEKDEELKSKYEKLQLKLDSLGTKPSLPQAFITTDLSDQPARTFIPGKKRKETSPAFLTLLGLPNPKVKPTQHGTTGRRLALANWIASPDNPLSTRVIVNRVWQKHFGKGLVGSANDFGFLGEDPSHPELLDWLATSFVEDGWKLKALHRTIMLSETYGQTAQREPTDKENTVDPENHLLWRFPPQRLSAEQIRDAMLATSGELKPKSGGSSVDDNSPHRSVYLKKRRNSPDSILAAFDAPSGFSSASERLNTTTSTQALLLRNNPWPHARARAMAKKFSTHRTLESSIGGIFKAAYGRPPAQAEIELALSFLDQMMAKPIIQAKDDKPAKDMEEIRRRLALSGGKTIRIFKGDNLDLGSSWTIEAIARLDSIHPNAHVNTLLSQSAWSHQKQGWSFGITSAKSAYEPRNFIMQLTGENVGGDVIYRVIDSNLQLPLDTQLYLACSIHLSTDGNSKARFAWKNLDDPQSKLREANVEHEVATLSSDPKDGQFLGGRSNGQHFWNGTLKRLRISSPAIDKEPRIFNEPDSKEEKISAQLDLNFSSNPEQVLEKKGFRLLSSGAKDVSSPRLEALTALCHAVLTSNEFLYLH